MEPKQTHRPPRRSPHRPLSHRALRVLLVVVHLKPQPHTQMILAQLAPDMTKGLAAWLVSAGAVLWIFNEGRKAFKHKSGNPPNEQLEISHNLLSRRVDGL